MTKKELVGNDGPALIWYMLQNQVGTAAQIMETQRKYLDGLKYIMKDKFEDYAEVFYDHAQIFSKQSQILDREMIRRTMILSKEYLPPNKMCS